MGEILAFSTPFSGKAYDASKVLVSSIPWGTIGKAVDFTVDASKAGEGNLEITISARGRNIPTQVHPQGSAKFVVSFVPLEGIDHIINITFNKELVTGAPFTAKIHTGKQVKKQILDINRPLSETPQTELLTVPCLYLEFPLQKASLLLKE